MKLLASVPDPIITIFGGPISPPPAMNIGGGGTAQQGLGTLIGFGISTFIVIAGFFLLIYLLWGAFDWISSGGEKEKIQKAQNKITSAVIGIVLVFVVLTVFNLLAGNMLGIVSPNSNGGFNLNLPSINGSSSP